MTFKEAIKFFDCILENGPLGTRLKYDYSINAAADDAATKKALIEIYESDVQVAQKHRLPILLNAATYRASRNHLNSDIKHVNIAFLNIANEIRDQYNRPEYPIYISAPVGSMYDAYSTEIKPSINEALAYHCEQIEALHGLDVDFINVVTIPSLTEAIGISLAAEKSGMDYTIGFILNNHGHLLDGTPVNDAIQQIDKATIKKPLGYLITCTHTSIISRLTPNKRLLGIQPNGSALPHTQLDKITIPTTDSPEKFASDVVKLKKLLGLKIVGGCCGTTNLHLKRISEAMRKLY